MRFTYFFVIILLTLFAIYSGHSNAQSNSNPQINFSGFPVSGSEMPDAETTPWPIIDPNIDTAVVPAPAPTGSPVQNKVNDTIVEGGYDMYGDDSAVEHQGSYIPSGTIFSNGLAVFQFNPPETVYLLNDGNPQHGGATLRILARPSDQCFAAGEEYYLEWYKQNGVSYPVPHGRIIVEDYCKNGNIVFAKEFGTPTWGINNNKIFSQAGYNTPFAFATSKGSYNTSGFEIAFMNNGTAAQFGPPGEYIALVYFTNGNASSIQYLNDVNGNPINEQIGYPGQLPVLATTKYPSGRTAFEMGYAKYGGTNLQCTDNPNFGVYMDWFAVNKNGLAWDAAQSSKFWNDTILSENIVQPSGCMYDPYYIPWPGQFPPGYYYSGFTQPPPPPAVNILAPPTGGLWTVTSLPSS